MEEFDFRRFDEYREDNRLEVKKAKEGLPKSVWESYSSMANSNGGVILLGVEENADGSFRTTGLHVNFPENYLSTLNPRNSGHFGKGTRVNYLSCFATSQCSECLDFQGIQRFES